MANGGKGGLRLITGTKLATLVTALQCVRETLYMLGFVLQKRHISQLQTHVTKTLLIETLGLPFSFSLGRR